MNWDIEGLKKVAEAVREADEEAEKLEMTNERLHERVKQLEEEVDIIRGFLNL